MGHVVVSVRKPADPILKNFRIVIPPGLYAKIEQLEPPLVLRVKKPLDFQAGVPKYMLYTSSWKS